VTADPQARREYETLSLFHEPGSAGILAGVAVRTQHAGRDAGAPNDSPVHGPVSRSERNTKLSMNRYPQYARCRRPHLSASAVLATETGVPTGSEHSTSNVQPSTFNGRAGWTLDVERSTLNVWPKAIPRANARPELGAGSSLSP